MSGGSHCERSEIRKGFGEGLGPGLLENLTAKPPSGSHMSRPDHFGTPPKFIEKPLPHQNGPGPILVRPHVPDGVPKSHLRG